MENEEYDSDILMAVGTVVTSYQKKAVVRSHHLLQGHLPLPLQASGQIPGSPPADPGDMWVPPEINKDLEIQLASKAWC